jgi:hypothetical protein
MKYTSIFALTLLAGVTALAQNDLSWVSQRSGNDSFPCGITNPCKTFQGAYAKTNAGGIIKALDAGDYGTIGPQKPIILDGNGVGATIEATTNGGVQTTFAGPIEIRNLTINVPASCNKCYGIDIQMGSSVIVEDVSITGSPTYGVLVDRGATSATIHGLTVTGASTGIYVFDAPATISDSIIRNSTTGIYIAGSTAVTQALIERSKMVFNGTGLLVESFGPATTARISDCVISANNTGASTSGGGQIVSFRNNTWGGNTTDGTTPFSISLK